MDGQLVGARSDIEEAEDLLNRIGCIGLVSDANEPLGRGVHVVHVQRRVFLGNMLVGVNVDNVGCQDFTTAQVVGIVARLVDWCRWRFCAGDSGL